MNRQPSRSSQTIRNVIMGRPHPLIVHAMQSLLTSAGYQPVSYQQMSHVKPASISGAVLSTSVTNDQSMTFEQVLLAIYEKLPGIPLVVATIMNPDFAASMLERVLKKAKIASPVIALSKWHSQPQLFPKGRGEATLLVHRDELENPHSRMQFEQAIRQHFQLRSDSTRFPRTTNPKFAFQQRTIPETLQHARSA